jgi:acyl carrier protein
MVSQTKDKLTLLVLDVLNSIQTASGRPCRPLTNDSRPLRDLDGFDSLNGLEATVKLERRLGCTFSATGVFVNTGATRALRLREVVAVIEAHLAAGRAA